MRAGFFIPCYVHQFYPQVAIATIQFLEKIGVEMVYPPNQTCCGISWPIKAFSTLPKDVMSYLYKILLILITSFARWEVARCTSKSIYMMSTTNCV